MHTTNMCYVFFGALKQTSAYSTGIHLRKQGCGGWGVWGFGGGLGNFLVDFSLALTSIDDIYARRLSKLLCFCLLVLWSLLERGGERGRLLIRGWLMVWSKLLLLLQRLCIRLIREFASKKYKMSNDDDDRVRSSSAGHS